MQLFLYHFHQHESASSHTYVHLPLDTIDVMLWYSDSYPESTLPTPTNILRAGELALPSTPPTPSSSVSFKPHSN
ncbi:uncharacterized protein DMAD_11890 [Drosophila madeirensis]|uniref:Uncharacterized protein n=1 Tax=Drosophila madeirensis TaxID=30013 RepID=A0AAU9FEI6_DROMD